MNIDIPIWLPLLLLLGVCGYWHIHENQQLAREWQKKLDAKNSQRLIHFAWSRTTQMLLALACCTAVVFAYDEKITALESSRDELGDVIIGLKEQNTKLLAAQKTAPVIVSPPAAPSPPPPAPLPETDTDTVGAIYNPEETATGQQSAIDGIKKRYEDILVTYFFLRKCGKIDPADYHIITSALSQEMASVNAPGRLQNDVLMSAEGSFKEMYATSECSDADTAGLYSQYNKYITTLTKDYVP